MDDQLYSSAPLSPSLNVNGLGNPAPEANIEPQSPRDFANPSHSRYRLKVLTVPTPLAPHIGSPSSTPASVMMISPPYQTQAAAVALPEFYSPAAAGAAAVSTPLFTSASPYQSHWQPF